MRHSKSIKAAAAIIAISLACLSIASLLVQSAANKHVMKEIPTLHNLIEQHLRRNLIRHPNRKQATSEQEETSTNNDDAASFDPNSYAYLIIHYHKTGHHLSRSLRDFLVAGTPDGPVSNNRENTFQHRMHEENTGCPQAMTLSPGIIHVQAAPNFFCDTNILVEYLLRNDNMFQEKKGVKIIHLVRNPFSLAVSNWIYHAQYPTPELWVKSIDPCTEELWFDRQSLGDLVRPTLLLGDDPVMQYDDFESLHRVCTELYRTRDEAKEWSFYTHLRHLDPQSALSLATTHMMIQGKSGGDILRMASNIVKLKQLQQLEDQIRLSQHVPSPEPHERMIQVMTLSMQEFTEHPKAATLRFLDFALGDASPPEVKVGIAREYKKSYDEKVKKGDEHITNDKEIMNGQQENIVEKKEELEGYLREHELFGRVLGNIERLVQDALRDSGSAT
eukprot:CAMPEP_0172320304 /NCGR_PEP_ID=MMETSP1058-20130122/40238_1 /TAXON_ID=83371 /ORGANISM="Detonula confervacea, Strain CCMP 353" /LENGTH=445 /DNA_ID=CAMNT_0013035539 /DNA_START=148 /DNA_END=1485 /DNA_ORIENTATION=+